MEYKELIINDIVTLIDKLEYLKTFLNEKVNDENELDILSKISIIHTDIQLISKKLNYKKK